MSASWTPRSMPVRLAVSLVIVHAACAPVAEGMRPPDQIDEDTGLPRRAQAGRTFDEDLYRIGEVVPEFAGFWIDESAGTTTVWLTGDADRAAGRAVVELLAVALDDSTLFDRRVVVQGDADYSFRQLFDWYQAVAMTAAVPGLVTTDIDEVANRIAFGVQDLSVERQIEQLLEQNGVPRDAVIIHEQAPVRQDSAPVRLRPRRPTHAGEPPAVVRFDKATSGSANRSGSIV